MIPKESIARDIARLIIWYPFRYCIQILPSSVAFLIFKLLGLIHFFGAPRRTAQLQRNIERVPTEMLPGSSSRSIVRGYLMNHYVDRLQIFLFPRWKRNGSVSRFILVQGMQHIEEALARGKGAIIIHPHFGPIQMKIFPLAYAGFNCIQIGLPTDKSLSYIGHQVAFKVRCDLEAQLPARIHPANEYMRPVIRHLQYNNVVLVTGDGAGGQERIGAVKRLPFLGAAMDFPEGPFRLAQMTGAALIPAFIIPERTGYYKLVIGKPFPQTESPDEAILDSNMRLFADYLERFIFRYPQFWHFWDEWEPGKRKQ